ncbi:MAG: mechanosensitive ion channel family protein [Candidatus Thermoplasmatota archaeon]|nr:mechanosensitive ion channel family protein [Candidatus Thermoplasmatota archaeon]
MVRSYRRGTVLLLLLVLFSVQILSLMPEIEGVNDTELPLLKGRVVDREDLVGFDNFTLVFERENLIPVSVITGSEGNYNVTLPPGTYTVSVYTEGGPVSGQLVDLKILNITWEPVILYDFLIDVAGMERSHVHGFIIDEDWKEPLEGCSITLINSRTFDTNITWTTSNGSFSIFAYPGDYYMLIKYDGEDRYNASITLEWGTDRGGNISIEGKGERPLITLEEVKEFLVDHWLDIVVLVVIIFLIVLLYLLLTMLLTFFKKKFKLLEMEWFTATQHFLNRVSILLAVILVTNQLSKMFTPVEDYVWSWMSNVVGPFIGILVTLLMARLLLLGNGKLWDYIRGKRKEGGKKLLPKQIISLLEIILRYLVFFISAVVMIILVLYAFGLKQQISTSISTFLSNNAGKMSFLIILVVIAVLLKRFIDIFFKELRSRSTKVSPQIMVMTHKGSIGIVYFVISLIFLFTLLSIGGLGEIGQSLILVISMIVGLVVSFAATGSIGNMLSGLVLMSMRPYNVNDRVEVAGTIGDVSSIGIMFTTLRDLDGRLHEIPNNNVLMGTVTNYTRSVAEGNMAVVIDVSLGYNINPRKVRALMKRAALASPGVLKDVTPRIIVRRFLDHAVEYRLRAYIDNPTNMVHVRSSVMESMLYAFHREGLEILSPMFHVKREGVPPTSDQLDSMTNYEEKKNIGEPAAEGLMMFDSIGKED